MENLRVGTSPTTSICKGPLNEVNQCPIKRIDDDRGEALSSDTKSCHFRIGCEAFSEDYPQQDLLLLPSSIFVLKWGLFIVVEPYLVAGFFSEMLAFSVKMIKLRSYSLGRGGLDDVFDL